ncbi:hypothetical protein ALI144C_14040 [Actinosynnema sp. ALI-1.44]|nr:hypothetical protein ALI144C_14040 [Actinosynnema sp. ALI-1.44]
MRSRSPSTHWCSARSRSVNEIRRLHAALTFTPHPRSHTEAWSHWRRRHQHRARQCHYQRRLTDHGLRLEY